MAVRCRTAGPTGGPLILTEIRAWMSTCFCASPKHLRRTRLEHPPHAIVSKQRRTHREGYQPFLASSTEPAKPIEELLVSAVKDQDAGPQTRLVDEGPDFYAGRSQGARDCLNAVGPLETLNPHAGAHGSSRAVSARAGCSLLKGQHYRATVGEAQVAASGSQVLRERVSAQSLRRASRDRHIDRSVALRARRARDPEFRGDSQVPGALDELQEPMVIAPLRRDVDGIRMIIAVRSRRSSSQERCGAAVDLKTARARKCTMSVKT
jgi:hypothetical protein